MVDTQASPKTPADASPFDVTLPDGRVPGSEGRGAMVGRYTVLDKIGAGGMGVVFRAYDPQLHREVAIKLLHTGKQKHSTRRRSRLLREARAMAQLTHPNVIRVYDVGPLGDGLFVAMEFVKGADAKTWLARVKPGWRRALGVFRAAGRGLAAAHDVGLVHRDFKPANVLVGDDGRVRVLDFGLARVRDTDTETDTPEAESGRIPPSARDALTEAITAVGTVVGTPVYMAPEQHAGGTADARSDQFSFCLALYEAVTGHLPYAERKLPDLIDAKAQGRILAPPQGTNIPQQFFAALERGLSPEPSQRFGSMPELLRELRVIQTGQPRRWIPWIVGISIAVVSVITLWTAAEVRQDPCDEQLAPARKIWNPKRRAALQAKLAASEHLKAQEIAHQAIEDLDGYAAAWAEDRRALCRRQVESGPELACAERRLRDFAALVDGLYTVDAAGMGRVLSAIAGVQAMGLCPKTAAEPGPEYTRLAAALREISVSRSLGAIEPNPDDLSALIEESVARSEDSVAARALLVRGELRRAAARLELARQDLERAYFAAVAVADPVVAAAAAVSLVGVLLSLDDRGQALVWKDHALAQLRAIDSPGELETRLDQMFATTP